MPAVDVRRLVDRLRRRLSILFAVAAQRADRLKLSRGTVIFGVLGWLLAVSGLYALHFYGAAEVLVVAVWALVVVMLVAGAWRRPIDALLGAAVLIASVGWADHAMNALSGVTRWLILPLAAPFLEGDFAKSVHALLFLTAVTIVAVRCTFAVTAASVAVAVMVLAAQPYPDLFAGMGVNLGSLALPVAFGSLARRWIGNREPVVHGRMLVAHDPAQAPTSAAEATDRSWSAALSGVSVAVALAGLLLFVPIQLGYNAFYGSFGLEPEDIGVGYAKALTLQLPWLLPAAAGLVAVIAVLAVCGVILVRRPGPAWLVNRYAVAPSAPMRRAAAVLAVAILTLAGMYAARQVSGARPENLAVPVAPGSSTFLRIRTSVVEVQWTADGPTPEIPDRMLRLGASDGMTVFWHPGGRQLLRLPTDSVAVTTLSSGAGVVGELPMAPNRLRILPDGYVFPPVLQLEGLAQESPAVQACASHVAKKRLGSLFATDLSGQRFSRTDAVTVVQGPTNRMYVLYGPDYRNLNAELLAAGFPAEPRTWYPTDKIKKEMQSATKAGAELIPSTQACTFVPPPK
ncbi:hypothetical protein [Actinoplanes sp. DH11]|uniref:hypothetical protein n=1 Tax=Actinoplanes sp. DH11 TaxID=2857011 RepID=UPI001E2C17C7|nr:hypothetical protein [Actinoplanes sp. DH11]